MNTGSDITAANGPITSGSLDGAGTGDNDTEYPLWAPPKRQRSVPLYSTRIRAAARAPRSGT